MIIDSEMLNSSTEEMQYIRGVTLDQTTGLFSPVLCILVAQQMLRGRIFFAGPK